MRTRCRAASVVWTVKYDGACARCGTPLLRGTPAVWDRANRIMHCIACPDAEPAVEPQPAEPPPIDVGVAGSSARREHERRAVKREARIEERFGHGFVGRVVRAISIEPQSTRAWAIGAAGEERLARELAQVPGIRILNDRRVPGTRGNIDHIVIAPAGVFVVDAKNLRGRIEIRDKGGLFRIDNRLYVGGRDRSNLARAMAWQVGAVQRALEAVSVEPHPPVRPVLCFIDGDWPLLFRPREFEGVLLEGVRSIVKRLIERELLGAAAIDDLTAALARALPAKQAGAPAAEQYRREG